MKSTSAFITALGVFLTLALEGATACCAPPVPVEGDAGLLDFLRDVQVTNLARYPRGKLTASVSHLIRGKKQWVGEVSMEWDGGATYSHIVYEQNGNSGVNTQERIDNPDRTLIYYPDCPAFPGGYLLRETEGTQSSRGNYFVRPDALWYSFCPETPPWAVLLDRTSLLPALQTMTSYKLEQEGDNVTVSLFKSDDDFNWEVTCSLAQGGNVISYRTVHPNGLKPGGSYQWEGTYSWVDDGMGGFRLSKYAYTVMDHEHAGAEIEIKINSFDPSPKIAPDRFKEESLKMLDGAMLTTRTLAGDNTTYKGGRPPERKREGLEARLNRIGKMMKEEPFIKRQ